MDIFTHIAQFWSAIIAILVTIADVLLNTTDRIDAINYDDLEIVNYLGYVKYVLGDTLWFMLMSGILISIGVTVYFTFLRGIKLVKDLLIRI
ncbi:hypothetical protein [Lysinibacillus xylanilyticus]|uniref:Uncharacterized protein n=2 Tax=Lysinibacillus xylanilyticus TaxID=582475 RepID=A0A2M9PXS6_9BACI|nr:hypothetical protein [Lysinibacillus xylanilyticus]PJO40625.1 hypothetical protein CWD94_27140 [Lysinibacillus xylanilyticus]